MSRHRKTAADAFAEIAIRAVCERGTSPRRDRTPASRPALQRSSFERAELGRMTLCLIAAPFALIAAAVILPAPGVTIPLGAIIAAVLVTRHTLKA